MNYEVKRVNVVSIFRSVSLVFLIVGLVVGLFAFLIIPNPQAEGLGFFTRLLAGLMFAVLYALFVTLGLALVAFLYNLLTKKIRGITLQLETPEVPSMERE